jgi:Glyoxalase-like domain
MDNARRPADMAPVPTARSGHRINCVGCIHKPDLSTLVVDLGLTGLPNVVGIDTVRIVIPRLKIPLIFKSRPHAPQPSQGRACGDDEGPRLYGGPMASVKQIQVTFDCAEPERVARFWCEVLGYVVPPPPEGFATWDDFDRALPPEHQGSAFACIDPSGVGPRLFFQRVPEGKVVKNRLHLDVRVGTGLVGEERLAALEAECARLVALGAVRVRLLPADDNNESCIVMQDIEGNEFDLD